MPENFLKDLILGVKNLMMKVRASIQRICLQTYPLKFCIESYSLLGPQSFLNTALGCPARRFKKEHQVCFSPEIESSASVTAHFPQSCRDKELYCQNTGQEVHTLLQIDLCTCFLQKNFWKFILTHPVQTILIDSGPMGILVFSETLMLLAVWSLWTFSQNNIFNA